MSRAQEALATVREKRHSVKITMDMGYIMLPRRSPKVVGGLVGYFDYDYKKLVKILGMPIEYKPGTADSRIEWIIRFDDGKEVWIYDYKTEEDPMDLTDWHVGGDKVAAKWVAQILGTKLRSDYSRAL